MFKQTYLLVVERVVGGGVVEGLWALHHAHLLTRVEVRQQRLHITRSQRSSAYITQEMETGREAKDVYIHEKYAVYTFDQYMRAYTQRA